MNISSPAELARYIDHTLLKADAVTADIEKLCAEAREHRLCSVCVNGSRVELARYLLEDSEVKVACVVGFPLGAMEADVKRSQARELQETRSARTQALSSIHWLSCWQFTSWEWHRDEIPDRK